MDPIASLAVRSHNGQPFYEAMFRSGGLQIKRRVGPAWLEPDGSGGWKPRRGRIVDGYFDERRANVRAAELVSAYLTEATE
jgi:hypothetical protein